MNNPFIQFCFEGAIHKDSLQNMNLINIDKYIDNDSARNEMKTISTWYISNQLNLLGRNIAKENVLSLTKQEWW